MEVQAEGRGMATDPNVTLRPSAFALSSPSRGMTGAVTEESSRKMKLMKRRMVAGEEVRGRSERSCTCSSCKQKQRRTDGRRDGGSGHDENW